MQGEGQQLDGNGPGGNYGGGAGGCSGSTAVLGGNGLIVITYAPNPSIYSANVGFLDTGTPPVTAYALNSSGNVTPLGQTTSATGLSLPIGIARDSSGKLYVANMAASSVTIYSAGASGNTSPMATITGANTALDFLSGIAVDSNRNISTMADSWAMATRLRSIPPEAAAMSFLAKR